MASRLMYIAYLVNLMAHMRPPTASHVVVCMVSNLVGQPFGSILIIVGTKSGFCTDLRYEK